MGAGARVGLVFACALAACKRGGEAAPDAGAPVATESAPAPPVVAEPVPRCRPEGAALPIPGEDVVVGDAAVHGDSVLVGLVRRAAGKRVASVARVPFDARSIAVLDVGLALGDAPPPRPLVHGDKAFVASFARPLGAPASGSAPRELRVHRLAASALGPEVGVVEQQADESFAFDVAWPDGGGEGAAVVAWDEDAKRAPTALVADRGVVKVRALSAPAASAVVASPEASDAEEPRLVARAGGGFLVAWLARRPEVLDAGGDPGEGPGERRSFRWLEGAALDAKGEVRERARALTSSSGRVASFDLVRAGEGGGREAVALVVDEAAHAEGAGARLLRVAFGAAADRAETTELLDGGVASGGADLLPGAPVPADARWLSWTDGAERAQIAPIDRRGLASGPASAETALAGARPLAALPGGLLAVATASGAELRRFSCR